MTVKPGFVEYVSIDMPPLARREFPYSIPAFANIDRLSMHPHVTFFVGENGSGKSTLIEAIAMACGFNPEGGSRQFSFARRPSESSLHQAMTILWGRSRPDTDYFLRAENFFNVATMVEEYGALRSYGGKSLHEQSHGESFLTLATERFGPNGLYILDEPEAALSVRGQLALLRRMHQLIQDKSQFIIATHSPILIAYPGALLYELTSDGIQEIAYEEAPQYLLTKDFIDAPDRFLRHLLTDD